MRVTHVGLVSGRAHAHMAAQLHGAELTLPLLGVGVCQCPKPSGRAGSVEASRKKEPW